ncbi:porin [Sphingomonas sp. LaA6.9]|uniref:porin n=1 Tax=Sphingomonas sp. LaA6.9 TaxID=2919914 RepID=UPI001F4F131A|nr:porin [Sphingomonas sp. LaA6.9]MCJ8159606.1 porin [Sphingomonas sp. LaA6.9]
MAIWGVAMAATALLLAPAISAAREATPASQKPRVSLTARGGIGSFTPAAADPRLAAILAKSELASTGFRFTPTSDSAKNRQVTVAVRARSSAQGQSTALRGDTPTITSLGIEPSVYNLGASIGWKRFALSGDVARIDTGLAPGSRQTVSAGASYNAPRWSGRVQVGADRGIGHQPRLIVPEAAYSLDVGGSYKLTRNLDVTAGVRYRLEDTDRLGTIDDNRRDSQAVYVGTAFRF